MCTKPQQVWLYSCSINVCTFTPPHVLCLMLVDLFNRITAFNWPRSNDAGTILCTAIARFLAPTARCTCNQLRRYSTETAGSHILCMQVRLHCSNTVITWVIAVCNVQSRLKQVYLCHTTNCIVLWLMQYAVPIRTRYHDSNVISRQWNQAMRWCQGKDTHIAYLQSVPTWTH